MRIQFLSNATERFIAELDTQTIAKILRAMDLLEHFGNNLGMPHSKHVHQEIFELRIRGKQEVRFLYVFRSRTIVVLHGFIKKSRRIPRKEGTLAEQRLKNL